MAFQFPLLRPKNREEKKERPETESRQPTGVIVALDVYDDIFSDFDTRPYSERGLSEDFLKELSSRTLETPRGELEVLLVMPRALRNEKDESVMKNRLRKHFSQELKRLLANREEKRRHGFVYFAIGAGLLVLEVYLIEQSQNVSPVVFALSQAIALPAGWFFAYTGLEKILQPYGEDVEKFEFIRNMHAAGYRFTSYEELEEDARRELERLEKVAKEAREKAEALAKQQAEKTTGRAEGKSEAEKENNELKKEEKK